MVLNKIVMVIMVRGLAQEQSDSINGQGFGAERGKKKKNQYIMLEFWSCFIIAWVVCWVGPEKKAGKHLFITH